VGALPTSLLSCFLSEIGFYRELGNLKLLEMATEEDIWKVVEPYLAASSLRAVVAQRLVRRLCARCAVEEAAGTEEARLLGGEASRTVRHPGPGCDACRGRGYRGRTGIYELLVNNDNRRWQDGSKVRFTIQTPPRPGPPAKRTGPNCQRDNEDCRTGARIPAPCSRFGPRPEAARTRNARHSDCFTNVLRAGLAVAAARRNGTSVARRASMMRN